MNSTSKKSTIAQLAMPGMPAPSYTSDAAGPDDVSPGQEVLYLGNLSGGPRYGAHGVVKRTLGRRAIVDMGRSGTWHIPYFFLGVPMRGS